MIQEWFTADEHYGHANIIAFEQRPFRDSAHMADELVARHNARVGKKDRVWHVGDFSLDHRQVKRILPRLNGEHILVAGNHDGPHPCHRHHSRDARRYIDMGFRSVFVQYEHYAGFLLCHLPYAAGIDSKENAHEGRYPEFRPKDDGKTVLVHGHVHSCWQTRGRMVNVGVDVWDYQPISLESVLALVKLARDPTADFLDTMNSGDAG